MFQVNIWNKICGSRLHACTFHWSHVSNNKKVSYYTFFCFDIWDPSNVLLSQSQSYFSTWITVDTHCITKTYDDVIMTSSSFWVDVIIPRHLIGLFFSSTLFFRFCFPCCQRTIRLALQESPQQEVFCPSGLRCAISVSFWKNDTFEMWPLNSNLKYDPW